MVLNPVFTRQKYTYTTHMYLTMLLDIRSGTFKWNFFSFHLKLWNSNNLEWYPAVFKSAWDWTERKHEITWCVSSRHIQNDVRIGQEMTKINNFGKKMAKNDIFFVKIESSHHQIILWISRFRHRVWYCHYMTRIFWVQTFAKTLSNASSSLRNV